MPNDPFATTTDALSGASRNPFAVNPHDVNELPVVPKALYVGTGGTIVLRALDGAVDVSFVGVPGGSVLDVRATHVRATGTTASNIVALA